jgi:hypothetical protein
MMMCVRLPIGEVGCHRLTGTGPAGDVLTEMGLSLSGHHGAQAEGSRVDQLLMLVCLAGSYLSGSALEAVTGLSQ